MHCINYKFKYGITFITGTHSASIIIQLQGFISQTLSFCQNLNGLFKRSATCTLLLFLILNAAFSQEHQYGISHINKQKLEGGFVFQPKPNQEDHKKKSFFSERVNSSPFASKNNFTHQKPVSLTSACINPAAPISGGDKSACVNGSSQTLTATATVGFGETLVWYTAATGGSMVNPATFTSTSAGNLTLYAEAVSALACTSLTRTPVNLALYNTPTVNAVPNQIKCNTILTDPVNFTGTVPGTTFNWTNDMPSIGIPASGSGDIASFTPTNTQTVAVIASVTVTPVIGNCTGTSKTFTLTIKPTPNVAAPSDQTVCNNTFSTPVIFSGTVAGTTFTWTNSNPAIGLPANGSGNLPSFLATNTGATPITATIAVTPHANGCVEIPQTFNITVKQGPTVNNPGSKVYCNGESKSISFSGTAASYTWTNSNPAINLAASGTGNITFTATNTGTSPIIATITVTPIGGRATCNGTPKVFTITVDPSPKVDNPGVQISCNSDATKTISFTGTASGYTWANNNIAIGLAASGTGNISFDPTNFGTTPIDATITVTPNASATGCVGASQTFTVTVNPSTMVNNPGSKTFCNTDALETVSFTGTAPGYSWTNNNTAIGLPASGTGNISFDPINLGASPITGTITITPQANGIGCSGIVQTFTITINPSTIVNNPGAKSFCNSDVLGNISFSGTAASYSWTNSNPAIGLPASGTGNISFDPINTGSTAITANITVTPSLNGTSCAGTSQTFTITVNPSPVVSNPGAKTFCNSDVLVTVPFSGNASGYTWTNNNAAIGLAISGTGNISFDPSNTGTSPISATITVTPLPNGFGCSGNTETFIITVNPSPRVINPGSKLYCGSDGIVTIPFSGSASGYSWTNTNTAIGLAASGTGNISFDPSNSVTSPIVATITVTPSPSVTGCTGDSQTFSITVNPSSTVVNPGSQTFCNSDGTLTIPLTGVAPGFTWTNNNTEIGLVASGVGDISFDPINLGSTPIYATITVTPESNTFGCAGIPTTFTIRVNPSPTVVNPGTKTFCNSDDLGTVSFAGTASGYTWTNSNTAIGLAATGNGNISFNPTNTEAAPISSIITVIPAANTNGCTGDPQMFTITVNPSPTVVNPGPKTFCNSDGTTSIPFTGTASGYSWTNNNPDIGLTASGTGNISFDPTNAGTSPLTATITVTPNTNLTGCTGIAETFIVTVNPSSTVVNPGPKAYCHSDGIVTIQLTGVAPGFMWTNSNLAIGLAASGFGNITFDPTNSETTPIHSTITVTPKPNEFGCTGSSESFTITINPVPTVINPGSKTFCNKQPSTNIIFTGNAANYTWTNSNPSIGLSASGTGDIPSFLATNSTSTPLVASITVTPTGNGCIGDSQTFTITIPKPVITSTPANQQICSGEKAKTALFTASESGAVFNWTATAFDVSGFSNLSGTGSIPTQTLTATGATAGKIIYQVTATLNGCEGPSSEYEINVVPSPTPAKTFPDINKRYSTPSIPIKGNIPTIGTGLWTQLSGPNTVVIQNNANAETVITGHIPGIYKFKWTISNVDCASSADLTIVVNAPPLANNDYFIGSAKSPISGNLRTNDTDPDGSASSLTISKLSDPESGKLTVNSNGNFTYIAPPGYVGTQTFTYKLNDADGGQDTATATLRLYHVTKVTLTSDKSQIQEGGQAYITPVLADPIHEDVFIYLRYTGTADLTDFSVLGEIPILIKAGETKPLQKNLLTITKDDIKELDETLNIEIDHVSSDYINIGAGLNFTLKDGFPSAEHGAQKNENLDIKPDPLTSPNGDGLGNEEFFIYNISAYPDNEVIIFNRWGNEVYRIKNYDNKTNAFRGKSNSGSLINNKEDLLDGVYYYLIYTKTAAQGNAVNRGYFIMKREK